MSFRDVFCINMTNSLLRYILNRTLVVSVRSICTHKKRFLCQTRGITFETVCRENTFLASRRIIYTNDFKVFSTSYKNCVKFFVEKENEHAHDVMKSSPGYSQRLYKRNSLPEICEDVYTRYITTNWSGSSPSELLSAFKDITSYCVTRSKEITEPELNNVCKAVAGRCFDFSDAELIACLECLMYWPETESLNSANFVDLWSALDKACVSRTKVWDISTMLYVADIWYSLHLSRVCKYVGECIWKLSRKVKQMSPQELVQCMFYMNSSRKFKIPGSMYEFEFYVEQCIQKLSVDELSIIAMGFFKSETPIRSPRVVGCMIEKTAEAIDNINEITLCSLMKLFRYCLPFPLVDDMHKLLDKTVSNISRLSLFCCVQVVLAGTPTQLFHRQIIDTVALRFTKELSTSRLKDIERMIFVLTLYDYVPECTPDIFDKVVAEVLNRAGSSEIDQYPKNLAYCLNYLCHKEIYPVELLDKVMSQEYIKETYGGKIPYTLGRELLCLDVGIEIECPNYKGNRLDRNSRSYLAKRYTKWVPSPSKGRYSATERIFMEVLQAAEEVISKGNVYADIISPNYALPDIVLGVDADGEGIPVAGLFTKYSVADVKYPPTRLDSDTWFCLVIGSMNMFIRNENLPLGTTKTKLRHLSRIGYHPILVPWFEFTKLTASEKTDYIRRRIFPTSSR